MALTVYLLHQLNQSRSRTIWVSNLGISFPGLAVELYLAFATWFAFCWMSCLHDQLTCFTNKFLATAYKLFLFFYLWQKKERKAQGTLPFWPVVQCQPLLFWPVVQCQPHGTRSMQSSLLLSSSQPYHYCESCSSYPVFPAHWLSLLSPASSSAPNSGELKQHQEISHSHVGCWAQWESTSIHHVYAGHPSVPQSLILASSLLHIGLSPLSLFLREVNNSQSTNYRLPW